MRSSSEEITIRVLSGAAGATDNLRRRRARNHNPCRQNANGTKKSKSESIVRHGRRRAAEKICWRRKNKKRGCAKTQRAQNCAAKEPTQSKRETSERETSEREASQREASQRQANAKWKGGSARTTGEKETAVHHDYASRSDAPARCAAAAASARSAHRRAKYFAPQRRTADSFIDADFALDVCRGCYAL